MQVELVEVTAADGVTLAGGFLPRDDAAGITGNSEAVLMMHGNGGNFYHPFQQSFAQRLARNGYTVLAANSRGHDVVSRAANLADDFPPGRGPERAYLGTALELIEDCILDWDAWLGYLEGRGFEEIILWGHSRGAVKAAYYLAADSSTKVTRAVLSSPPWFSCGRWLLSDRAEEFKAHLSRAQEFVGEDQPDALMEVTLPTPYICGAASYLDSYGPAEKYNVIHLLEAARSPVLTITGTAEVASLFPFQGLADALDEICRRYQNITHISIPGGDHMYSGKHDYVYGKVQEWLRAV